MTHKQPTIILLLVLIISVYQSCNPDKTEGDQLLPERLSYNFHIRPILSDKCFACHGPDANKREANLRLDDSVSAYNHLDKNDSVFVIVKGKPAESELFRRITSDDPDYQMPTPGAHVGLLSQREIALVEKWIAQGAVYEKHWAFIPPEKSVVPHQNRTWGNNEIDFFIADALEHRGLEPNEEADEARLLKRVAIDLTGLPPSDDLMREFSKDHSAEAYEKIVDKLMKLPAYGEKMALPWLDIARYADSYGYQDDNIRTQWPWRDWVIHAFNNNMPYDAFITWQLAGDLLPGPSNEQKLATAFLRNHKYTEEGGVIPEEYRIEYIIDKTKTYGKGILGVTVECAQCHDHKYDPFSQKDYYRLFAFFNNSREVGYEGDVGSSKPAKTPILKLTDADLKNVLSFINKKDTTDLMVSVMEERDTLRKTFVLDRGVYDKPTIQVTPSGLTSVLPFDSLSYPLDRLGLAAWTMDKKNPLTARVFINLLWQNFFGRGLVKTSGDFGMQGELPSHPELLDWLAVEFMEHNWDIKYMVKMIVMSATYRQSSKVSQQKLAVDPENIYLSRAPRQRLPAELVRDLVLSTSGLLVDEVGGPSVKPYQPDGVWESSTSGRGALAAYEQDHNENLYRRGIYTFIKLTAPPPSMIIFDGSNRDQCEVKRSNTNTPLQALVMMNDPLVLEASRVLAERLSKQYPSADSVIKVAFRKIICRNSTEREFDILQKYFTEQLVFFKSENPAALSILQWGEHPHVDGLEPQKTAALMKTITIIYNIEEAITKS